tara:strand:- start:92 stop:550 length:459 start_codon:yes stop_codon:yes gene_type:complete
MNIIDPKTMHKCINGWMLLQITQTNPDADWSASTNFSRRIVLFEGIRLRESSWVTGSRTATPPVQHRALYLGDSEGVTDEQRLIFISDGNPYLYYNRDIVNPADGSQGMLLRPDQYLSQILNPHLGTATPQPVVQPVQPVAPAPVPAPVTPQ